MFPLLDYKIHEKRGYICISLSLSLRSSVSPYLHSSSSLKVFLFVCLFGHRNSIFSLDKRYELFHIEKEKWKLFQVKKIEGQASKYLTCSTKV